MSHRATVIAFMCSLVLVGSGIVLTVITGSSVGVVLMVPGLLLVILISILAVIAEEPPSQRPIR
jgi:hypothetical protein